MRFLSRHLLYPAVAVALSAAWFLLPDEKIDFSTQIKPLINRHCITCHGGVKQEGGFSLLFREDALRKNKSGRYAIVPGRPAESELLRRITSHDAAERMPYRTEPLSAGEIAIFRRWIKQGAPWGQHWAYTLPSAVRVPKNLPSAGYRQRKPLLDWVSRDLDYFVADRLAKAHMSPSPMADKPTLLRRVSLDLTGLPPPDSLAKSYLTDHDPQAYEKLIDTLLASPAFGEKWASMWLDLARYADTKGYERDDARQIWRYRDWVIGAFNADQPYDVFLTEQLAGDLLPNPSDDQRIATAFHRNTMTNDEGGTDNEEFRTAAVLDRVNTTWEAVMGTTFSCVQCHAHPYDPFRHEDYYRMMAYFNNSADHDTYEEYPLLRHFTGQDSADFVALQSWTRQYLSEKDAREIEHFVKTRSPVIYSLQADSFTQSELADTKWLVLRNNALCRLKGVTLTGKTHLMFKCNTGRFDNRWTIHVGSPNGPVLASTVVRPNPGGPLVAQIPIAPFVGKHHLYFRLYSPQLTEPDETALLFDWFYFNTDFPGIGLPGYENAKKRYWSLIRATPPTTPIMLDQPAAYSRPTAIFKRGNWLDPGALVEPGVPASLHPLPKGAPPNRLGLAQWITNRRNPLTARTMVNRIWEQIFGLGLVETVEDLGSQGSPPLHRELLDYLALRFMHQHQWRVKGLIREILLSATYRQDSRIPPGDMDPQNRLLARGPRVRLSAEQTRDQALALSGLLSRNTGGPGVMPYQPPGVWQSPWNGADWVESQGEDRYRRAVYTYWKRSSPYPSTMMFDGVSREVCVARRIRTNTPLQALVTWNDPAFVEMAEALAKRMFAHSNDPEQAIGKAWEWAFFKPIDPARKQILVQLYQKALRAYSTRSRDGAPKKQGRQRTLPMSRHALEREAHLAALGIVASTLMNTDEWINKT